MVKQKAFPILKRKMVYVPQRIARLKMVHIIKDNNIITIELIYMLYEKEPSGRPQLKISCGKKN
jgi:hypothetical protein